MHELLHACELINCRLPVLILLWVHLAQCLTAATAQQSSTILMMEEQQQHNDNLPGRCSSATDCPDCAGSSTVVSTAVARRPYFRTALARSVYSKILVDREFRHFDKSQVRKQKRNLNYYL